MGDSLAEIGAAPLVTITNPIDYDVGSEAAGYTIAYSPDGSQLAAVGINNTAKIWDADSGKELHTLGGHTNCVYSVSFSPDGQRLATASKDGTVKIWDVKTGQVLATLTTHTAEAYIAVFSPDGGYLVTGSTDQTAIFWDLRGMAAGGQPRAFFTLSFESGVGVAAIAFSPDGKRLAINRWQSVWVYALDFSKEVPAKLLFTLTGHKIVINGIVFTPDGKQLVSGSADGSARVWNATTGQEKFSLVGNAGVVYSIALSPDGQRLLTATKAVQIWDISLTGNQEWFTLPGAKYFHYSPDRKRLLSYELVYGIGRYKKLQFWEPSPEGLKELGSIQIDTDDVLQGAVPDRDLNHYITVGAKAGEGLMARVWDIASGQEIFHFPLTKVFTDTLEGRLDSLAISPDGGKLATGVYGRMNGGKDAEGLVVLWDLHTGVPLHILEEHPEGIHIYSVAFSPDGARVATGCDDGKARIFDASNGQLLQTLSGHQRAVMGVDFNQDGTRLVTGSWDGTVIVWDTDTGYKLHPPMKVCPDWVLKANFNPDGSKIAASCLDQKVHLVDTSTGKEWLTLPGEITGFSPDSKYLWSFTEDGITRGFYLDVNDLIILAHKRLLRTWTSDECQTYLDRPSCPPPP
jgi:WD40 repeat protein